MQTSKLILLIDFLIAIFLSLAVIVGAFLQVEVSPITAIAVGWDAQLAVATGFYYWKSKNENRSKHAMKLVRQLANEYGIENVIDLANVILKD